MFEDIVLPQDNEQELASMAKKLGYDKLWLAYSIKDYEGKKDTAKKIKDLNCQACIICEQKDLQKAQKHKTLIIVKNSDKNRQVIEKSKANYIVGIEQVERNDAMHHRHSGINQVLAKLLKQKNKGLIFSLADIFESDKQSQLLGRISQNIKFARKFQFKTKIASFASNPYSMRAPKDLISLFISLGMSPGEAKKSLENIK
ncbi:hypothetical protein GOV04_02290 [Candidatus Woesearchaeota archaeon]|nr:hypothetical protein [Candidatus Woesearchaeota archaeon]